MKPNNYWIILTFIFVFSASTSMLAQDEILVVVTKPSLSITHQIGVNGTSFLNKIIRINGIDTTNINPYQLTYRLGLGRFGLRFGVGGHIKRDVQQEDGFADSKTTKREGLDARIGVDFQKRFGRRFTSTFGLDMVTKRNINNEITDSGFDVIQKTNQGIFYGGGPCIGINYWPNSHFGIGTEASFYVLYGSTDNARIFKNFPELNDQVLHIQTTELVTVLPASIFILFRF